MTTLTPWTQADKDHWFSEQTIKRSYAREVLTLIERVKETGDFSVIQYGALSINPPAYPVFMIRSKVFDAKKKTVLITGGVHGYETSGVHGAIAFMQNVAIRYSDYFNFVCNPCISPWGYETINRWTPKAIDPNRSFAKGSDAEECAIFLAAMEPLKNDLYMHIDLHETTDTDNTVFRPALEQRDGKKIDWSEIPDGFYVVGDSENPQPKFQKAIIDAVRKVTHIAEPDKNGNIIGDPIEQDGVINYPVKSISLCAGFSNAEFTTTTEVYPDSPRATPAICTDAQIAAICGGLDYLIAHKI